MYRVWILSIVNMVLLSVGEGLDHSKMGVQSYRRYGGRHTMPGASPRYEPLMRKDVYKRLQGLDDRLMWLLVNHRNVSAAVQRTDHKIHRINHRLNGVRETESIHESKLGELSEKISKQNKEITKLKSDNAKLKQTLDRLSRIVDKLNVGQSGNSVIPADYSSTVTPTTEPVSTPPRLPKDCRDVYIQGTSRVPGNYYVMIQPIPSPIPFQVCCQITNTTGWTVIQRRMDGSVDFYRSWNEYKHGFGNLETEFWLGNDKIHKITTQGDYKLRIELETWDGNKYFAEYDSFRIANEGDKYRLHIRGYTGNAGDSLTSYWENHDQQQFSTKDSDHDNRFFDNCAEQYKGAWWFKSCFESHLNGLYKHRGGHDNYFQRDGIQWNTIHLHSSLKYTAMMVKPADQKGTIN